jgi:MoaA/NifB/PqqE/SkfB family radical SAM enzyme
MYVSDWREKINDIIPVNRFDMAGLANLISQICRSRKVPTGPTGANIEISSLCDLNCSICRRTSWKKGRSVGNMTVEQFLEILRQLPALRRATLTGIGEPLLNKNLLPMLRIARDLGVKCSIVTNGTLLPRQSDEVLKEMRGLCSQIIVSLDSPDPDEFEEIRKGARFTDVVEGIRVLANAGDGQEDYMCPVRVNTVVMESTKVRMPDMVELCADLGANIVTFY